MLFSSLYLFFFAAKLSTTDGFSAFSRYNGRCLPGRMIFLGGNSSGTARTSLAFPPEKQATALRNGFQAVKSQHSIQLSVP
jgi:hypothetical protein